MKFCQKLIKVHFLCIISALICLQAISISVVNAQNFSFSGTQKRDVMNFNLVKNLIIIPVYINGKGPFDFILDTGVNPMIITDPSLPDTLGIKNLRAIKINGFGEEKEIDASIATSTTVSIGDATAQSILTVVLKEDVFNLSGYLGKKIYGLIGYNFFQSFVVRVNYITKRLNFQYPIVGNKYKGEQLPLEFLDNKPYINTQIKTEQGMLDVKLVVDCGASHALSLEKLKGEAFPLPEKNISANLGLGLSGIISGNIGRVSSIKLGNYTLANVLTNYPKFSDFASKTRQKERNGNLGSDILKHFNVTYDYQNLMLYLKKNNNYMLPFDHDMSGMEIYTTEKEGPRYIIGRIEEGSPAEKGGLMENDEILGINFRAIETFSLDELSGLMKSDAGKTFVIEIWRKDRTFIKLLTLKRRI